MRLKTIKTGYAVKVGNKEQMFFSGARENNRDYFEIEAKHIPEINECMVEIKHQPSGAVSWTTFANIVYAEPDFESLAKPVDVDSLGAVEHKAKRGRPFKLPQVDT